MGVGVEETVHEDLLRVGPRQDLQHGRRRHAEPIEALPIRDANGRVVRHGEDAARRVRRHDGRHHDLGLEGQVRRDLRRHPGLAHEVELLAQDGRELVEEAAAALAAVAHEAGEDLQREAQQRQIGAERGLEPRMLDLDHHLLAVGQARTVRLGDGGGAERSRVELGEGLLERSPQLGLDHRADRPQRQRLHAILQGAETLAQPGRAEVVTQRSKLAQLDEGALQRAQRSCEGFCGGALTQRATRRPLVRRRQQIGQAAERQTKDDSEEAGRESERRLDAAAPQLETELLLPRSNRAGRRIGPVLLGGRKPVGRGGCRSIHVEKGAPAVRPAGHGHLAA